VTRAPALRSFIFHFAFPPGRDISHQSEVKSDQNIFRYKIFIQLDAATIAQNGSLKMTAVRNEESGGHIDLRLLLTAYSHIIALTTGSASLFPAPTCISGLLLTIGEPD